jgi:hypothetical protein
MNDPQDVSEEQKYREINRALEHLNLYTGSMVIVFPSVTAKGTEYLRIEATGFPRPVADAILRHAAEHGMYADEAEERDGPDENESTQET